MGNQRQLQSLTRHAHSDAARLAAQRKMYCVWFVAVVVPFAILFCLFPSSNQIHHRTSRLPASAKARVGSTDSILNSLEQQQRVESLSTKLEDRSPDHDQKSEIKQQREPRKARSTSRVREIDSSESEIQGSAADDRKKKRFNGNVNRKHPEKGGFEKLRVEGTEELGSIFGSSEDSDGILISRGSQKSKRFNADSAHGKSDSMRATSKERAVSGGSQKKKSESEDLPRVSGENRLISPEISRKKKSRSIKGELMPDIRNNASVQCDVFKGKWIPDNKGPGYANASCPWIDEDSQKCKADSLKYLQWRWKPDGCALKSFNAKSFLKSMEGKALAFVGDSLARGQGRSLLCLLARVESPNSIYVSTENKSTSWHFPSSNFTLTTVWAPYLVQETEEKINGASDGVKMVRLDVVEPKWARLLPKLDAVVLSAGSWLLEPAAYVVKNQVVGCHGCASGSGVKELGLYSAYRAATRSAIIGAITLPWYTGTTILQQPLMETAQSCTVSSSSSLHSGKRRRRAAVLSQKISEIQRDEFERALKRGIPNESRLELSETTTLTFQHPTLNSTSGYVDFYCNFFNGCLTGPSLTWNQLLLHILRRPRPSTDVTAL